MNSRMQRITTNHARAVLRGFWDHNVMEGFFQEVPDGNVVLSSYSCGMGDDMEASPEDVARYRGKSALSPIESAALVLLHSR
jgi:hypothetical protein